MVNIQGGYVLISVGQLANVCAARREREISFLALRVWLAAHEQRAKRCVAKRKLFTVAELAGFVRESETAVQRALKQLTARGLISWAEREIEFPRHITLDGEEIASDFGSSGRRPVPIPRQLLRALFRHTRPSEVLAAIAHLIRCLFIRKGDIKSGGLVKASAVAATLGIAERSVHAARKWLLSAGFLVQEAIHQLVKNRFGGKFTIVIRPRVVRPGIRTSAPPSKNISTRSSTSNNQINNKPASAGSGVQTEHSGPPTLRDIRPEDLRKPRRLEQLYREAVKAGWLEHSEANIRNFACAALRATRSGGRVGAIFVGIVRKKLWHHITQEQEDRALSVLNRFRQQHANAFDAAETQAPQADARLSALTAAVLQRKLTPQ